MGVEERCMCGDGGEVHVWGWRRGACMSSKIKEEGRGQEERKKEGKERKGEGKD